MTEFKTISEHMFAGYLAGANLDWSYEPQILGQSKRPDFSIATESGVHILVDIKERNVPFLDSDPIKDARHLIKKGLEKFSEFGEQLCAIVLYENNVTSFDEFILFSAMLGDPGVEFGVSLHAEAEVGEESSDNVRGVFLPHRGKLIKHYPRLTDSEAVPHASATNLSAVIAMRSYDIPNPEFAAAWDNAKQLLRAEHGRSLTASEEVLAGLQVRRESGLPIHLGESLGLIVCMNPFARFAFPATVFNGPLDERWSIIDETLTRTFVGEQRSNLLFA